jgi:hypothetical protein
MDSDLYGATALVIWSPHQLMIHFSWLNVRIAVTSSWHPPVRHLRLGITTPAAGRSER